VRQAQLAAPLTGPAASVQPPANGHGAAPPSEYRAVTRSKAACGCAGECARVCCGCCSRACGWRDESPQIRYDWWLIQLTGWVLAVLLSRELGGQMVPLASYLFGDASPFHRLANAIDTLQWSCAAKRWTFAGILRIAVDLLQLFFVDWFNKFRKRSGVGGGQGGGARAEARGAL